MFFGKIELAMGFQTVRTHLMKKTANHVKDRGRRDQTRKKVGYRPGKNFGYRWVPGTGQNLNMPTPGQGVNSWKCKFSPTCILKDQVCDGKNVYNSIFF